MSLQKDLNLKFPIYWSDFAVEPKFARHLIQKIIAKRPKCIVELGSGVSTLISAQVVKMLGIDCVIYSYDSDNFFLQETKNRLDAEGLLTDNIELEYAPIAERFVREEKFSWYQINNFPIREVDILVVDGPKGTLCKNARYPALPLLMSKLASDACILLDDANREDETNIVNKWSGEYKNVLKYYKVKTNRGLVDFQLN